jgi:hypothetical protein
VGGEWRFGLDRDSEGMRGSIDVERGNTRTGVLSAKRSPRRTREKGSSDAAYVFTR